MYAAWVEIHKAYHTSLRLKVRFERTREEYEAHQEASEGPQNDDLGHRE